MQSYHHGGLQKLQLDGEEAGTSYAPCCPFDVIGEKEKLKNMPVEKRNSSVYSQAVFAFFLRAYHKMNTLL